MVMRGIDISKWQSGIDLSAVNADFVIVKATEGIGYVDKSCDGFFQKTLRNLVSTTLQGQPTIQLEKQIFSITTVEVTLERVSLSSTGNQGTQATSHGQRDGLTEYTSFQE